PRRRWGCGSCGGRTCTTARGRARHRARTACRGPATLRSQPWSLRFVSPLTHIDACCPHFGSGSRQLSLSWASNPVLRHNPEGLLKIYRDAPGSEAGAPPVCTRRPRHVPGAACPAPPGICPAGPARRPHVPGAACPAPPSRARRPQHVPAGRPGAGTMGYMIAAAAEYALADLAVRLGGAQVAGWSPAEHDLAAAAAAATGRETGRGGRDFWNARGKRDGLAGLRARIRAGEDPLGQEVCRTRPPERRRGAGQTFTPAPVVDNMISWAGRALTPARVVDPGAGSARFLAAAGRRWPEAELIGLETDPLAALIGRATLAAAGLAGRATIELADYRSVRLPAVPGRTLFLGNPA